MTERMSTPVPGNDRDETTTQRSDRNWEEILQELRVTQTGTQIITGFLLTLAFQPRFTNLDGFQVGVYLVLVAVAALTTAIALAPVSLHRTLFRQKAKEQIVRIGNRAIECVLVGVALILTGTVLLIFDFVVGRAAGLIAGLLSLAVMLTLALALPASARAAMRRRPTR